MPNNFFSHKSAIIDENVTIGDDSKIWHFCHISSGAKIGKSCSLGQNVFVGGKAVIGDNVKIQNNVSVYDGVVLEDFVFCGPSMVFTNDQSPRSQFPKNGNYLKTVVKTGASIGANVTVVCGHTIGRYALIGAGSVVTKDIPDHALAYGNPAKVHGWVSDHGDKLTFHENGLSACKSCGKKYQQTGEDSIKEI